MFDLSIIKNIDFADRDTLIFISIVFVLAIISLSIMVLALKKIIRLISRAITVTFNLDVKKPKFDKKNSTEWLHQKSTSQNNTGTIISRTKSPYINLAKGLHEDEESVKETKFPERSESIINQVPVKPNMHLPVDSRENVLEVKPESPVMKVDKVNNNDASTFDGKPEISRIKLEHEMRKDPKIWEAAKEVGLEMGQAERSKLIKEVFPRVYGRNISKTDVKWGIKKLNQKMLGAKNPEEHAKIRKEIKFFKKIGGIK